MEISQIISEYKIDTIIIAVITSILTAVVKIPVKRLAERTDFSQKITRFITFLPLVIGFGLTVAAEYLIKGGVSFTGDFYVQWLSAASLSLAIYAFWEKFVPSEKQILSVAEIEANNSLIEELKSKLNIQASTENKAESSSVTDAVSQPVGETASINGEAAISKKIILTNKKQGE